MARKLDGGDHSEPQHPAEGDSRDRGPPLLARRDYVKLGVAAAAATVGAGATLSAVSAGADRAGIEFGQVLDAVEDLGIDPEGGASMAQQLTDLPANTLVQFPAGTYLIDERVEFAVDGTLGFEADGDATIKGGSGFSDVAFDVRSADAVYYAGFTHDQTDGRVRHRWQTTDRLEVADIEMVDAAEEDDEPETASGAASALPYETIVLEPGEQRTHRLSDGERFENVLIDQTAEGAMFTLLVEDGATDWTIRNVGWKGRAPVSSGDRDYAFLINVRGDGVIENIFIDQRGHAEGESGSGVGAIWTYSDSHHGHIDCRHNFIAGCGNNACYDSGDGWEHYPGSGTLSHEHSYHRDNTPSNFRPGKSGSSIRNCVSIANDPEGARGAYPGTGSQLTRACWAWHNPGITMENCAVWWDPADVQPSSPFWATHRSGSEGDSCTLHVIDCDINHSWQDDGNDLIAEYRGEVLIEGLGHEPSVDILGEGVPVTPEMAARGERTLPPELGTAPGGGHGEQQNDWTYDNAEGVHTDLPYELVIEHATPGERVTYEVEFDGQVEVGEWEHNATLEGTIATGGVGPEQGLDNMYFDGDLVRFDVENQDHARYYLADAQTREVLLELDPDEVPFEESGSSFTYEAATGVHTDLPREFVIELVDPGETVSYELEVDGELEVGEFEYPATVEGSIASGRVGPERGIDNLYFDGEITGFDGEHLDRVRILIADAQTRTVLGEFDPTTFPEEANPYSYALATGVHTDLPHELVIEHKEPGDRVEYELEVLGTLENGEFDYPASIDGMRATGGVGPERGLDNLYFDGAVTRLVGSNLEAARIYLADAQSRSVVEVLDPADLDAEAHPTQSLRVIGSGTAANYEFTVSGTLVDDPDVSFDASGNISGGNAEGTVADETHGYLFAGELEDARIDGDATVFVDGEAVRDGDGPLDNLVRIDGSIDPDVTRYRFEVTGSVAASDTYADGAIGTWDRLEDYVSEDGVTGIVHERIDAYRYSGDIASLAVYGPAAIDLEDIE